METVSAPAAPAEGVEIGSKYRLGKLIAVSGRQAGHGVEDAPAGDGSGAGVPVLDRACRTQQWIERDGRREEPLGRRGATAGADRAVHALERAS